MPKPRRVSAQFFSPLFPNLHLSDRAFALGILLVAVLWGAAALMLREIGNYSVETDFYGGYAPHAQALLNGRLEIDPFKGPGYELALASTYLVVREWFRAGVVLSVLSAALLVLFWYHIAKRLFNQEAAILSCLGIALNQHFLVMSYTAGTDMFFAMLTMAALLLLVASSLEHPWLLLGSGLVGGFAYLTRYNGIAFLAAALGAILVYAPADRPKIRRLVSAAIFLAGSLIFILPFAVYTHSVTGSFFRNDNFLNIGFEMYGNEVVTWDDYWKTIAPRFHSMFDVLTYDPWRVAERMTSNIPTHAWNDLHLLVFWPIGLAAVGGFCVLLLHRMTRLQATALTVAGAFFLVLIPVFYGERFSLFLVPFIVLLFVLLLQSRTMQDLGNWWQRVAVTIILLFFSYSGVQAGQSAAEELRQQPTIILKLRDAFRKHHETESPGTRLSARKPHAAFLLEKEFVPLPYADDAGSLVTALQKERVDYLYISERESRLRPWMTSLLDTGHKIPGLDPIVVCLKPQFVLYRVARP